MEVLAGVLIILALLTTLHPVRDVPESEMALYNTPGVEHALKYQVRPLTEFNDENIVKQKYDYSCGSAALATILNYYLGEHLTEQQVIQGLLNYGDAKMIEQRRAFSLLDMKRFVNILGYEGAGYTAELRDLISLGKPCIVPVEFFGYKHFVVYKGIYGDHIFFADPYMGNISFTLDEFEQMWHKNIVFLITDGDATLDALLLKEEDLRIVEFENTSEILPEQARFGILLDEHRLKESIGRSDDDFPRAYQYKGINVR